jgi:hypothetical protein
MTRMLGPSGSARRRRSLFGAFASFLLLSTVIVTNAFAVHDDGLFELDRNATSEATPGEDWDVVFAGTDTASASSFVVDGVGPTIFTGGGSKDDLNTTGWKHKNGSTPDKDELLNGYAARYEDNVYFGADRFDNSGDAVMGFWFFQQEVVPQPGGSFGPGQHEDGDILVLSNFSGGGGTVNIRVFQWNAAGGTIPGEGAINHTLDLLAGTLATPADCVGPPTVPNGDNFCGTVNTALTDAPWTFLDKNGSTDFRTGEFYEGGIDLAFLGLEDECFASFLAETRSSTAVNAVLKDFVGGAFQPCESSVETTPSDSNGDPVSAIELGDTIHDYALITGTGSSAAPTGTMDFFICSPGELTAGVCSTGGTEVNGSGAGAQNPPVTVTQVGTTATSEALSSAFEPNATGTWCWRGEYSGDDNYPPATDATSGECFNVVDAKISVSPLVATNEVGTNHVVTATVEQDTGSGFVAAPDGTTVTFSLENNNAGAVFVPAGASTCTTTGGSCSVTITSTTTGTVDIRATTTFTVGGLSVTRTTGSGGSNSADANKRFVDAQIDLSPLTATNLVNTNHTITATVQQDDGLAANTGGGDAATGFGPAPDGTTVTFNFAQNTIGATFVNGVSTCTTTGGQCSIQITSSTPGTVLVHATTTFDIGPAPVESVTRATNTGGLNGPDVEKIFEDIASTTTAQSWLPQDTATITAAGGSDIAGTVTFQLFESADCTGTVVQTFADRPVTGNQTDGFTATTNNETYYTTATTISWRATFTSTNSVGSGDPSHCETMTVSVLDNDTGS